MFDSRVITGYLVAQSVPGARQAGGVDLNALLDRLRERVVATIGSDHLAAVEREPSSEAAQRRLSATIAQAAADDTRLALELAELRDQLDAGGGRRFIAKVAGRVTTHANGPDESRPTPPPPGDPDAPTTSVKIVLAIGKIVALTGITFIFLRLADKPLREVPPGAYVFLAGIGIVVIGSVMHRSAGRTRD